MDCDTENYSARDEIDLECGDRGVTVDIIAAEKLDLCHRFG